LASNKFKLIKIKAVINNNTEIYKIINRNIKKFEIKELYLNNVKKNKDWIYHKKNKVLFFALEGSFVFKLYSNKKYIKINISRKKNLILIINPNTWFKISAKKNMKSLLLCAQNNYYDKNEFKKLNKL